MNVEYKDVPSRLCAAILEDLIDEGYGERWNQKQANQYFDDVNRRRRAGRAGLGLRAAAGSVQIDQPISLKLPERTRR